LASPRDVAVLIGSIRKDSHTLKVTQALIRIAPPSLRLEIVEIRQLPYYNQDHEQSPPPEVVAFRERVRRADAVLFATPEYNRSVPGVLKNAVDTASRPRGHNMWGGKPGAVISVTPGQYGAMGANHHLRQSLVAVGLATLSLPEVYIAHAGDLFDEKGEIKVEPVQKLLGTFVEKFAAWIETVLATAPGVSPTK
jgi:chromate reductase, NAD(P)H dehydrogenase (quinone)